MSFESLVTDEELCKILRISRRTLYSHMKSGPPKRGSGDLRTIKHFTVGGSRRWVRSSVEEFIMGARA